MRLAQADISEGWMQTELETSEQILQGLWKSWNFSSFSIRIHVFPKDHLCSSLVFLHQNHSLPTPSKISGANQLLIRVSSLLSPFPDVLGRMTVNQSLLWKCLMSKRMLSMVNFPLTFSATNSDVTSGTALSNCSRMADVSVCYLLMFSWTHFFSPFPRPICCHL